MLLATRNVPRHETSTPNAPKAIKAHKSLFITHIFTIYMGPVQHLVQTTVGSPLIDSQEGEVRQKVISLFDIALFSLLCMGSTKLTCMFILWSCVLLGKLS